VLEDEGAGAVFEDAGDDIECNVAAGGAFGSGSCGEHGALAGGFEVAVELFVDEHAADGCASGFFVGGLGIDFDFEGAGRVERDHWFFFC
jgi:hypothetical protein